VILDQLSSVAVASVAAGGLALLSAVAGFGGGVLLLPVFTALFGLRVAVPMLTPTQVSSNGLFLIGVVPLRLHSQYSTLWRTSSSSWAACGPAA
jgi:uncharacterized membrane protein YfcA